MNSDCPRAEGRPRADMLVDEAALLGVLEYGVEQRLTLCQRHVEYAGGHQPVHVNSLAAGVLVAPCRSYTEDCKRQAVEILISFQRSSSRVGGLSNPIFAS